MVSGFWFYRHIALQFYECSSFSNDELKEIVVSPGGSYKEYPNWDSRYEMLKKLQSFIEQILGKK
jgi:hypothetical protein